MSRFDVVVVGSLNLDLVARTGRLPRPGETVSGRHFDEIPGGKGLNQAVAAARAGASVAMVGAVGNDAAGRVLRDVMRSDGIDGSGLSVVEGTPTGRALIAVDDSAENSIVVVPGANAHVVLDTLPDATVVLAQLEIDPEVVTAAFRIARSRGATTVLDPAPADRLPDELIALCDILVPNEHELEVLGGVQHLAGLGVGTLVVTRGAAGADLVEPGSDVVHIAPFAVVPVDTTGAGDAFCGGLAARLARGDALSDALAFAAANGALAATAPGAVPSLPTADRTRALLEGRPVSDQPAPARERSPAATAAAYLAAFRSGDPDRVADLVTDDFVNDHASALGSGCEGRDEYRRRLPGFLASLPGLRYEVEQLIVDGDTVAAAYRLTATSDGHPVELRGVMVIETRRGLVARRTDYWDALTFLRQTGQA